MTKEEFEVLKDVAEAFPEIVQAASDFRAMCDERDKFGCLKPRVGTAHAAIDKAERLAKRLEAVRAWTP